ncbi:hypothetical protein ASPZODRAFT_548791 [Penicilliopsis zonata CBS 506.65]|uniref:Uncharacterized protein n=1 Tax=Penicilliopsis zonata CBS 506.65 TaxID=1073090 RepID=A0A1L9SDI0_9EURO|nr:hypothetical protein ASPZODRAFT_548791 [Penicilliopsis zonata CBS 506.65]OJJ45229.1 hypothetical protein ASPZODRAFT_548791 [Penicilliopsis zonata CBS 506.65]
MNVDMETKRWLLAIDFGTTFSSLAFAVLHPGDRPLGFTANDVHCITDFPDAQISSGGKRNEVPSQSWYPMLNCASNNKTSSSSSNTTYIDLENSDYDSGFEVQSDESGTEDGFSPDTNYRERPAVPQRWRRAFSLEDKRNYFWGFSVDKELQYGDQERRGHKRISRSKLLLDTSEHTEALRNDLRTTLSNLEESRIIVNDLDVIEDYLTVLLHHAKIELTHRHGLCTEDTIELVLCVPVVWTRSACRSMQTSITNAAFRSQLVEPKGLKEIYVVSEPEAATAQVLSVPRVMETGETFVLLDAGGGTVDAITYKLHNTDPLKLEKEAVPPEGALCGSSYLNEAFERLITKRLSEETYLTQNGLTPEGVVAGPMTAFENVHKRVDVTNTRFPGTDVNVTGLKANRTKRFKANRMVVDRSEFVDIFKPLLEGIANLMIRQINMAYAKNITIDKVVLIGGFAASRPLRRFIRKRLAKISLKLPKPIRFLCPQTPETAVATGAVLRALYREEGPSRLTQSSYGFLINEVYDPGEFEAHRRIRMPRIDRFDGERWVRKTIQWVIKKGDEVAPFREFPQRVIHTFPVTDDDLVCREILYVSDRRHESHYRIDDPINDGWEIAGIVKANMSFLRDGGYIHPIQSEDGIGDPYYSIEYDVVIIVDGPNLKFKIQLVHDGKEQVMKQKDLSIAAAFASLEGDSA